MKRRALFAAAIVLLPAVAWTVSKDFNGRMWLAQVPGLPGTAETAYAQWIDDNNGGLKPGQAFQNVDEGINNVQRDQAQANMPSQSQMQQQMSGAQQMAQKFGTPEGQAALKNMDPSQLMAMAQQMSKQMGQPGMARVVSPADQVQLQKIGDGVYSGHQQLLEDQLKVMKDVNGLYAQWDADAATIEKQQEAEQGTLPVCKGEASIPSGQTMRDFELKYAGKRMALAATYLPRFTPMVDKMRAVVTPEIDFGDDALAAWTQIEDPGLKQQASASANGAENVGLGDVGAVEQLVERISERAAKTVADEKAIQRKYANATGCQ